MDIPIAVHVESGLVETHQREGQSIIKHRSLRNTLNILKKRLLKLKSDASTTPEDVHHYKV
jgi:hypothetical protein